jgi:hypothetical protein
VRLTADKFLDQVNKGHTLKVLKDDGLYRHLRISLKDTWYEIITAPNYLFFVGDMGDYCFSRIEDMFAFHRKKGYDKIDFSYWAEKIQMSCRDGIERFDTDQFISDIKYHYDITPECEEELRDACEESKDAADVLRDCEITYRNDGGEVARLDLSDDYELFGAGQTYTYRYLWCCYAVVFAIHKYDEYKEENATRPD